MSLLSVPEIARWKFRGALYNSVHVDLYTVAILDLSTEGAQVPSDMDKIEELSFQYYYGPQNWVRNCCIGANKHTRLEMTNKITIRGQAYAPSGPP